MLKAESIKVSSTTEKKELSNCLRRVLYVPNEMFKERIISILIDYISERSKDNRFFIKPLIAYRNNKPVGFVNCMVHPDYRTYNRRALTFGWLTYDSLEICQALMERVESIARTYKYRRIRGNINFPKGLGGIGFQTSGFEQPPLYGVAFNSPKVEYLSDLDKFGYKYESEYSCLQVNAKNWDKGTILDDRIEFRYRSFENVGDVLPKAKELAKKAFYQLLPDTSSGQARWNELFALQRHGPHANLDIHDDFCNISTNEPFLETWNRTDLTNINSFFPMAFDKHSGELVGFLLGIPNLYEEWKVGTNNAIHTVNVDTALVHPDYKGLGIFSGLNNIGQLTCGFYGIDTFEGTYVWSNSAKGVNNEEAIRSIFPHCSPIRTHVVVEKKIRMSG
jgi:hypothetical protein